MTDSTRGHRSRYEIMAVIIEASLEPARMVQIVDRSFLNFGFVKKYIHNMLRAGLLRRIRGNAAYEATERGLEYLEAYRRARRLLNGAEGAGDVDEGVPNPRMAGAREGSLPSSSG